MQTFAEVVQFLLGNFFNGEEFFFDFKDRCRICIFDTLGQPVPLDDVENYDPCHYDEEDRDTDLAKITDHGRNCTAEEEADAGEDGYPKTAAYGIQHHEAQIWHFSDSVKHAHCGADAVDVFGNDDSEAAKLLDQFFDPGLGYLIETIIFGVFVE